MFGYFYGIDSTWFVFVLPAVLLAMWAQMRVKSAFRKYSRIPNLSGMTGAQAARRILDMNGLNHVRVEPVQGELSDHYDPRTQTVCLSTPVYGATTVAAVGIAAHECGHAVQHSERYAPLTLRNAIVPVTQIGSNLAVPLIILGFVLNFSNIVFIGILCFALAAFFQLVTLPVEFNASHRAMQTIENAGMLYGDELRGARKVLSAAAMTYVAALFVALANLLRFLLLFSNMRRRD